MRWQHSVSRRGIRRPIFVRFRRSATADESAATPLYNTSTLGIVRIASGGWIVPASITETPCSACVSTDCGSVVLM